MERWLAALAIYKDPRMLRILLLGFSSGLPLLLTLSTLSAWLATQGVSLTAIGLFALVGLPYSLKFVWSPAMDGLRLPWLSRRLGQRRGWALLTQAGLVGSMLFLGFTDPVENITLTAIAALLVAFFSASQDIVVDAYRVEILEDREQAAGAAAIQVGYRLGMLVAGAGALFIADSLGWFAAFAVMAALVSVGVATILASPEPAHPEGFAVPGDADAPAGERLAVWLRAHVVEPFGDFARRRGWLTILLFILLYKFGDAVAGVMANPFYIDMGFSLSEIASVSKIFGLIATLSGVAVGGVVCARYGLFKGLLACGILQMVSNLMFAVQASVGHDLGLLVVTIGIENFSGGMGSAAFVAYLSSLCNVAFTATQYALFSSFAAWGRTLLSSSGGWMAESLDWVVFFIVTTGLAAPGLVLLVWLARTYRASAGFAELPERATPHGEAKDSD
jgi:MFS transporter, PAT family, beta-lactamase induction signal transducer AmpG